MTETLRENLRMLPPGSTPYRHPAIHGRAVAIYFALQPPTLWAPHAFPCMKIAVHLGLSNCDLTWNDCSGPRQTTVRGEYVCFFGRGIQHGIHWKSEAPMVWIFVNDDYLHQIGFNHVCGVTCVELVRLVRSDLGIFRLAALFHEACFDSAKPVPLYVEAKGTLLATRLVRAQFGSPSPVVNNLGLNTPSLNKVQAFVQTRLAVPEVRLGRNELAPVSREQLSNAVLARIAGMSEHHFIRKFGERMKKSPQEYVMLCRLEKAEELIMARGYSPKEAAYATGFCEPGHFYRRFRQRYGHSPHELLKQSRPEQADWRPGPASMGTVN